MQTSSHWLIGTAITTAPAAARSTKPIAIVSTSRITTCFSTREYTAKSARYAAAIQPECRPQPERRRQRGDADDDRRGQARPRAQLARRNRPPRFERMLPIGLAVA